jgi:hypothetical protein
MKKSIVLLSVWCFEFKKQASSYTFRCKERAQGKLAEVSDRVRKLGISPTFFGVFY